MPIPNAIKCMRTVRSPALYASDTPARQQQAGEDQTTSGAEGGGGEIGQQRLRDAKDFAANAVPATSHESDSEEWVESESSPESSFSSDDDSDRYASVCIPAGGGACTDEDGHEVWAGRLEWQDRGRGVYSK